MHYAGYYLLSTANPSTSRNSSAAQSRRASEKSTDSQTQGQGQQSRRSSIKKALDMLRPYESPMTEADMYAPVTEHRGLFSKKPKKSTEEKAQKQEQRMKWNMEKARYELISAAA